MNQWKPLLTTLAFLALAFFPWQAVQAQGPIAPLPGGGVTIGSSYILEDGETATGGAVVIGGSALLESGSIFYGDLVVIGGSATLEKGAEVNGAVVTVGGSLIVNTEIQGDVVIIGGPALLQENARVRGDVVTIGGPVQKEDGAEIDGKLIDNPTPPARPEFPESELPKPGPVFDVETNPFWESFWLFGQSVGYGLLAALIVLFLPQQTQRVAEAAVREPLRMSGMGILTYILFAVVMVTLALFSLLIITAVLTIPAMIILGLLMGAGMAFGWMAIGTEIGVRLLGLFNREWPLPLSALVGTFLLTFVTGLFEFIQFVGWGVPFFLTLLAVGAVAVTRFGTQPGALSPIQAQAESDPPAETM